MSVGPARPTYSAFERQLEGVLGNFPMGVVQCQGWVCLDSDPQQQNDIVLEEVLHMS